MREPKSKSIRLIVALILLAGTSGVAQSTAAPSDAVDCGSVAEFQPPPPRHIISFGVMNGKARSLVAAKYPAAAQYLGIHGNVDIRVLIDPRGCVAEAVAVSGNPILVAESLKAAKRSVFVPQLLSEKSVWAYGVIEYRFVPERLNWLELGYHSLDIDKLISYLPFEYQIEREQLKQALQDPTENRYSYLADARASIIAKLSTNEKDHFLFTLGSLLRELEEYGQTASSIRAKLNVLQGKIDTAPTTVSIGLRQALSDLVRSEDPATIRKKIKHISDRSYLFGR